MNLKTGGSPDDTITVKVDRYTFDGVYKDSFEHDMEHSNVKPLYFGFQTFPGKHVITVSKPQCIARVYEIYLYKDDISFDVKITVPYDVNMDGVINVVDATLVQNTLSGLKTLTITLLKLQTQTVTAQYQLLMLQIFRRKS